MTPGLVFSTFNGAGQPYVRGIGADQLSVGGDSAGPSISTASTDPAVYALNQDFFDVERVEVLKGPEGAWPDANGGAIDVLRAIRQPDWGGGVSFIWDA